MLRRYLGNTLPQLGQYLGSNWTILELYLCTTWVLIGQLGTNWELLGQYLAIPGHYLNNNVRYYGVGVGQRVGVGDLFWKFIFSWNRAWKWFNSKFNSKQNPKYSFKKYSFDLVREILYNYSFKRLWGKSFKIKKKAKKLQSQNSAWYSKVSRND